MRDLRITSALVSLKITGVSFMRGFNPPSIIINGLNLRTATEVLYNGFTAPEFIVSSDTAMVAQIPTSQVTAPLSSVQVLANIDIAAQGSAPVYLGIGNRLATVEGPGRMIQTWMSILLTTPGSDIFAPKRGGGARKLVGSNATARSSSLGLVQAVEAANSEMLRIQAATPGIPMSERLASASITSLKSLDNGTRLSASVSLVSMAGTVAQVAVG